MSMRHVIKRSWVHITCIHRDKNSRLKKIGNLREKDREKRKRNLWTKSPSNIDIVKSSLAVIFDEFFPIIVESYYASLKKNKKAKVKILLTVFAYGHSTERQTPKDGNISLINIVHSLYQMCWYTDKHALYARGQRATKRSYIFGRNRHVSIFDIIM